MSSHWYSMLCVLFTRHWRRVLHTDCALCCVRHSVQALLIKAKLSHNSNSLQGMGLADWDKEAQATYHLGSSESEELVERKEIILPTLSQGMSRKVDSPRCTGSPHSMLQPLSSMQCPPRPCTTTSLRRSSRHSRWCHCTTQWHCHSGLPAVVCTS